MIDDGSPPGEHPPSSFLHNANANGHGSESERY